MLGEVTAFMLCAEQGLKVLGQERPRSSSEQSWHDPEHGGSCTGLVWVGKPTGPKRSRLSEDGGQPVATEWDCN